MILFVDKLSWFARCLVMMVTGMTFYVDLHISPFFDQINHF